MAPTDPCVRAALEWAGLAIESDDDWAAFATVSEALNPGLDQLAAADLGAVPPEIDLDPSRPPSPA